MENFLEIGQQVGQLPIVGVPCEGADGHPVVQLRRKTQDGVVHYQGIFQGAVPQDPQVFQVEPCRLQVEAVVAIEPISEERMIRIQLSQDQVCISLLSCCEQN